MDMCIGVGTARILKVPHQFIQPIRGVLGTSNPKLPSNLEIFQTELATNGSRPHGGSSKADFHFETYIGPIRLWLCPLWLLFTLCLSKIC